MTRYFPGDDIEFNLEYKNSDGALINADTVTFKYRMNREDNASGTPTNVSTGKYAIWLTPSKSGVLRGEWSATKDDVTKVKADKVKVWPSEVQGV